MGYQPQVHAEALTELTSLAGGLTSSNEATAPAVLLLPKTLLSALEHLEGCTRTFLGANSPSLRVSA